MTAALKTVIVDALRASTQDATVTLVPKGIPFSGHEIEISDDCGLRDYPDAVFDLDRLATAVLAFVLDREKVRAALIKAFADEAPALKSYFEAEISPEMCVDGYFNIDALVDRLIEGLVAGGLTNDL